LKVALRWPDATALERVLAPALESGHG
jgi:hypothetical protein